MMMPMMIYVKKKLSKRITDHKKSEIYKGRLQVSYEMDSKEDESSECITCGISFNKDWT
jgi:hypothetical protein